MTLLEKHALIANPLFFNRVRMAGVQTCYDVLNDPERTNEYEYARRVLNNPLDNAWLQPLVISVIQNATIASQGTNSTDNDIQFVVNSVYPIFSIKTETITPNAP